MFWTLLYACTSAPTAPPPEPPADVAELPPWADASLQLTDDHVEQLQTVRMRVGLAAKGDDARCEALVEIAAARDSLGTHFTAHPDLPAEKLNPAIPGLIFAAGSLPSVDVTELGRAFGRSSATTAMVSATAFTQDPPVWKNPERGCFDTDTARPWVRRLQPSLANAPECLRDHYRDALLAELERMGSETCFCGDQATATKGGETVAVMLTKDPDGSTAAVVLRKVLSGDGARFDCSQ